MKSLKMVHRSLYTFCSNVSKYIAYICIVVLCSLLYPYHFTVHADNRTNGFSFDCDNTKEKPCRQLVGYKQGNDIEIEASSAVWSDRYKKVIVVSDNFNDLLNQGATDHVIVFCDINDQNQRFVVKPLLSMAQVEEFNLYDLEGVTILGDKLYAIGSLALHGKDPARDRWERHQFIQLDLRENKKQLYAENLSHVTSSWPNFRDWLISTSGYKWSAEAICGRAEGKGINVEALSATADGNFLIGFRGPLAENGGVLAIEIKLPADDNDEPVFVQEHIIPALDTPHIPNKTPKSLRAITMIPDKPGHYYVILGPKGYEKENLVLARWNSKIGELTKATLLPDNFVAEGITSIPGGKVLVVDDLKGGLLIATEE